MALQGPFVVVADSPAPDVVEALQAAGAFPIIETNWADAAAAMASVEPEAVVLAEPCGDREHADEFARALDDRIDAGSGAFTPVIARAARRRRGADRRCAGDLGKCAAGADRAAADRRVAHPRAARHGACAAWRRWPRAARACRSCRTPIRSKKQPCWSPAAAARIPSLRSPSASVSAWSARSASRARRARSMHATSTAWSSATASVRASSKRC